MVLKWEQIEMRYYKLQYFKKNLVSVLLKQKAQELLKLSLALLNQKMLEIKKYAETLNASIFYKNIKNVSASTQKKLFGATE